jgi:hypothetical protein
MVSISSGIPSNPERQRFRDRERERERESYRR